MKQILGNCIGLISQYLSHMQHIRNCTIILFAVAKEILKTLIM